MVLYIFIHIIVWKTLLHASVIHSNPFQTYFEDPSFDYNPKFQTGY